MSILTEDQIRAGFEMHFGDLRRSVQTGEYLNDTTQAGWVGWLSSARVMTEALEVSLTMARDRGALIAADNFNLKGVLRDTRLVFLEVLKQFNATNKTGPQNACMCDVNDSIREIDETLDASNRMDKPLVTGGISKARIEEIGEECGDFWSHKFARLIEQEACVSRAQA